MSCLSLGTLLDETSGLAGTSGQEVPSIPSLLASIGSPAQPYGCLPLQLSPATVHALPVRWCVALFRQELAAVGHHAENHVPVLQSPPSLVMISLRCWLFTATAGLNAKRKQ